jgi:SET domain-containing protein
MASPLPRIPDDDASLAVRPSRIAGVGLFTLTARKAGERLIVIDGEVIDGDETERRDALGNAYIYELTDDTWLDAARTLGRFVNHACEATCDVLERDASSLWLVAARDLGAGEELTIDYDYPEIFEACRSRNPACLGERCPKRGEWGTEGG